MGVVSQTHRISIGITSLIVPRYCWSLCFRGKSSPESLPEALLVRVIYFCWWPITEEFYRVELLPVRKKILSCLVAKKTRKRPVVFVCPSFFVKRVHGNQRCWIPGPQVLRASVSYTTIIQDMMSLAQALCVDMTRRAVWQEESEEGGT